MHSEGWAKGNKITKEKEYQGTIRVGKGTY